MLLKCCLCILYNMRFKTRFLDRSTLQILDFMIYIGSQQRQHSVAQAFLGKIAKAYHFILNSLDIDGFK